MNSWTAVLFFLSALAWYTASSHSTHPLESISEPDLNCNFERGFNCPWLDVPQYGQFDWTPKIGEVPYRHRTGPLEDHTTGHGYFLLMEPYYNAKPGNARIQSPPIATNMETCLTFWYFMYGKSVAGLNVYRIGQDEEKTKLFTKFGKQGKRWFKAIVDAGDGAFKLQIEATYQLQPETADIAIDDITFAYHPCHPEELTQNEDKPRFNCDFEEDLCSWDVSEYHMTWQIKNGQSDRHDRNPLQPYTSGSSYAEAVTTSRDYNSNLHLSSPTISVNSSQACLSFWYRIDPKGISVFQVKLHEYGKPYYYGGKHLFSVQAREGSYPIWTRGLVTLPEGKPYYISFYVRGRYLEMEGTVDLDDVQLTYGHPCTEDLESLINCDFESDFCLWYMASNKSEGDWKRTKDPTPTNATGPSHDHTTGDGYYIFLDGSAVEEANLYTRQFSVGEDGACLSFWYYMQGADVNTLQLRSEGSSHGNGIFFERKGPQGDKWMQQNMTLKEAYKTNLVFTARRSYFPRSDIALDDISITFGAPCESDVTKDNLREKEKETTWAPPTDFTEIVEIEPTTYDNVSSPIPTTTTTEEPPLQTPVLRVLGKVDPASNNSRVELLCEAPHRSNTWIEWYKKEIRGYYPEQNKLRNTWGKKLVFEEIQPKDAGIYSCMVTGHRPSSNESNTVLIKVVPDTRPSPRLEIQGSDVYEGNPYDVLVDAKVTLVCGDEIDGGEYHWKTTSHAFGSYNLPKGRNLALNSTHPKHSGIYSCRISKDEFWTAKSNELRLEVRPGKRCERDWHCSGDNYHKDCDKNRCECSSQAVVHGRECRGRPGKPKITTSPAFLEFGIGESFYVLCEADEPAPLNLTYTFIKGYQKIQSPNIMKISNATERDTDSYKCFVTYNGVHSWESLSIYIQIKDFIDLDCDFNEDFCVWFQNNETDTADFVPASSGHAQNGGPNGPFIQLEGRDTDVPSTAVLISPTIERMTLDSCLTFWYRMHGPAVHSLSIWRYAFSRDSEQFGGNKLWTVVGDKGDDWLHQKVTVGNGTKFYILFEAIGQIEIDDVTFTYRGGC